MDTRELVGWVLLGLFIVTMTSMLVRQRIRFVKTYKARYGVHPKGSRLRMW